MICYFPTMYRSSPIYVNCSICNLIWPTATAVMRRRATWWKGCRHCVNYAIRTRWTGWLKWPGKGLRHLRHLRHFKRPDGSTISGILHHRRLHLWELHHLRNTGRIRFSKVAIQFRRATMSVSFSPEVIPIIILCPFDICHIEERHTPHALISIFTSLYFLHYFLSIHFLATTRQDDDNNNDDNDQSIDTPCPLALMGFSFIFK